MASTEITILNWDKFNPRKDIKNPTWFALSNRILENADLFDFSAEEFKAWIYILCQASQINSETVKLNFRHASRVCGIKKQILESTIEKLEKAESLQARTQSERKRTQSVHECNATDRQTNRQTDTTCEDFLNFWNSNCGELPKVKKLTDQRKAKVLKELKSYPDQSHWLEVLEKWKASKFCIEEWRPSFDDWLREDLRIKTLEGKYDNRKSSASHARDWGADAQRVLTAVRRFGSLQPDETQTFLGEELYKRVRAIGGMSKIGLMPANDFTVKNLESQLRNAPIDFNEGA